MKLRTGVYFWLCLVLVVTFAPAAAYAQPVTLNIAGDPGWVVEADRIKALHGQRVYLVEGGVHFTRGEETIRGDSARYDEDSKTAEIKGNVIMSSPDFKVTCRRLVVNLVHNVGKMYDGTAFFPQNHYYVSGDEIERTGPESFHIIQGRATTCDGPNPAWTLTGRNIRIRVEGYATAEHVTLQTKYLPLLYIPWVKLPVKTNRQTGLLMPKAASSSRDGLTYTQPFYWAVSDSKDLTLYLTYRGNRGLETTLEARYNDWGGKGVFQASYMRDQTPPTITYDNGKAQRESRYWIRGMADHETEDGFNVKLDLDMVSDPKYLDEFEGAPTGYDKVAADFLEDFGREFAETLDPLRKTTLQVTKSVGNQNWRFGMEYTDDLNDPDNIDTLQRLPRIGLDMVRQNIPGTPFYFSNESEYTFFSRKTDENSTLKEEGHRLDIHPQISWPARIGRFVEIEAEAGFRETLYFPYGYVSEPSDPTAADRNHQLDNRELFDFNLDISTNLVRVYNLDIGRVNRIKHRIKPEISFQYVSEEYQGDLPYWDEEDRVGAQKELRYGLVNYLVAKVKKKEDFPRAAGLEESEPKYNYVEFFRLGVFRSYDYVEAGRSLAEPRAGVPADIRKPHGPWEIEAELNLPPYFKAQTVSSYDTYAEMFTDHTITLTARDRRGDILSLEYDLHEEPNRVADSSEYEYEELRGALNLVLNEDWSLIYERRFSFRENNDIETLYALEYKPQCWGIRFEYREAEDENVVAVFLTFLGLGEVGGQSDVSREEDEGQEVEDSSETQ